MVKVHLNHLNRIQQYRFSRFSLESALVGGLLGFLVSNIFWFLFSALPSSSGDTQPFLPVGTASRKLEANAGWKDLSVYVGLGGQDYMIPQERQWHSQTSQDFIIAALFNETQGPHYFIDLASNDAVALSNTLALERDFGWEGLCIEPNPKYWEHLVFRKCHVLAALIGDDRDALVDVMFGTGAFGGIVADNLDNKPEFGRSGQRRTTTFANVLQRFQVPKVIHYFSLDVEGAEDMVMNTFPWDQYTFLAITVERPSVQLKQTLKEQGYVYKYNVHPELYLHSSFDSTQNLIPKGNLE
jgi:hypothetical protein